jgi:uncharacterized protein (DUF697 family)
VAFTEHEWVRKRLVDAAEDKKSKGEKAAAVIWAAIGINAGLGVVPFGINIWTFVGVVVVMVSMLGTIYGYHYTNDDAAALIKHIIASVGATWAALTLGMKFFTEVLKGTGVITLGGATAAGMALDAVLCGAVTYALGYTTKTFLDSGKQMTEEQIRDEFRLHFKEGKRQMRRKAS